MRKDQFFMTIIMAIVLAVLAGIAINVFVWDEDHGQGDTYEYIVVHPEVATQTAQAQLSQPQFSQPTPPGLPSSVETRTPEEQWFFEQLNKP